MARILAALLASSLLLSGCEDSQLSQQQTTCLAWAGFAAHQYVRYLEGDMQQGELTSWAVAHVVNTEDQARIMAIDAVIPMVELHSKGDMGISSMSSSVLKACTKEKWSPIDPRTK